MGVDGWIFTLTLQYLVVSRAGALEVTIPQKVYEFARGDNITLPCKFVPKNARNPLIVITWTAEGDRPGVPETQVLTHYSTGQTDIRAKYEGRVSLDQDMATGKADLKLSSITLADNRVFECRLMIPKDDEGKLAATTRLIVLVAPSTPICKIEGKAEYGQNINLTCFSEEGSPTPAYLWESRDVRNMPRVKDPRINLMGSILPLHNVSKETSGYYTCTSSNKIRSASCNITLTVMPPSMNFGSTAGIIGGAVAAVLVLIIIIYCCCCRKKKKESEEYVMGAPEGAEFHDKEPTENGDGRKDDRQDDARSDIDDARREDVRSDYDDSSVRSPSDRRDNYEERSERDYDRRSDYDDRRSDYDDRRSDYTDRRDRYSDDRRERYDDDRRYDDRSGSRDGYNDRHHDDDRRERDNDDRYDEPHDDRDQENPPRVPANKPSRINQDD